MDPRLALLAFSPCVTQRTDSTAPAAHPDGMNTNKSIRCAIGRHRWQPTPVAGMHERICLDCGSARFDASIHPDHEAPSAAVSASGLALAHSVSDGGFGGAFAAEGSAAVLPDHGRAQWPTAVVTR